MKAEYIDKFLAKNENKFPDFEIPIHRLLELDDKMNVLLEKQSFTNPHMVLLISILFGVFGSDRFINGDIWIGLGKLLTLGGLGIWAVIDWFRIMDAVKRKNMNKLVDFIQYNE